MPERRKYEMPIQPRDTSAAVNRRRAAERNPDPQAQDKAIEETLGIPQPNMPLDRAPGQIFAETRNPTELVRWMLQQAQEQNAPDAPLAGDFEIKKRGY